MKLKMSDKIWFVSELTSVGDGRRAHCVPQELFTVTHMKKYEL